MPILITIFGAIAATCIWYWRLQRAREAADVLLSAANDVRLAARRFGFRNKLNVHPAEIGIFGRWIACQCGSRADSVRHLAKRLVGIAGQYALPDLIAMIEATQSATGHGMGEDETDAIANKPGHQK